MSNKYTTMKIRITDKIIAYLTLLSGLSISAVAVYYSVAGLVSIFAAAAVPIMVMGITLEVSKLIATVWLKQNWSIAPKLIRAYLMIAVFTLMLITSMGIFGYLSKAHLDQAVPTGDVAAKIELIDEKIKTQRDNISTAQAAIRQMDNQVNEMLSRSTDNKGTERAVQIRRNQAKEREKLAADIGRAQTEIAKLNEERAPIAKELRKVEAEVGPIKYIAALIYDTNPGPELLEKAVRWVIILIVFIFDPLAVVLLLASQYSFSWFRKREDEEFEQELEKKRAVAEALDKKEDLPVPTTIVPVNLDNEDADNDVVVVKEDHTQSWPPVSDKWPFPVAQRPDEEKEPEITADSLNPVDQWNKLIAEAEKAAEEENKKLKEEDPIEEEGDTEELVKAKTQWKQDHPDDSLKHQRQLLELGVIKVLPWTVPPYFDPTPTGLQIIPDLEEDLKKKI